MDEVVEEAVGEGATVAEDVVEDEAVEGTDTSLIWKGA